MKHSVINFAVYEDSREYVGVAKVTLPDLTALTQTVSGAGIAGNIEEVILGHYDSMTLSLEFLSFSEQAIKLSEPRRHNIDLRIATQNENTVKGTLEVSKEKHIFVIIPKSSKGGSAAPASPSDVSGEYSVRYWATYIEGRKVREIDPLNFIHYVNGVDYLEEVRRALGK